MRKIEIVIFSLCLTIIFAVFAYAKSGNKWHWKNKVIIVNISDEYHHLGDDYISGFTIPEPEGTFWEKQFSLPKYLKKKHSGYIIFSSYHIDYAAVSINNHLIDIERYPFHYKNRNRVISVPAAFFNIGKNTITFEVFQTGSGNWDDLEFGELEILIQ